MMWIIATFTTAVGEGEISKLPLWAKGPGYPEIPVKVMVINLRDNERVSEIRIGREKMRPINYPIRFARVIDTINIRENLPEVYPQKSAFLGNQGFFRGHNLAFVLVPAIKVINGKTYLVEEVEFDMITVNSSYRYEKPKYSNPKIWGRVFAGFGIMSPMGANENTVDFIIITTEDLKDYWKPLINLHSLEGFKGKIFTVEWINQNFEGNGIQEKIRNFLKFAYINWGISAVLIGADAYSVPPLRTYVPLFSGPYEIAYGNTVLTDFYYAAIDGDWNTDGNYWYGDMDSVDFVPDIMVGRFPATTPQEVEMYVQRVIKHQTYVSNSDYSFNFFSANLFGSPTVPEDSADGCISIYDLSQRLTSFPRGRIKFVCEKDSRVITDSINSTNPTVAFFLMHANHRVLVNRNLYYNDFFEYSDVDNIENANLSVVGLAACFGNEPFSSSVGKEFVMRGKAATSIGSSKADFTMSVYSLYWVFYDSLNTSKEPPTVGYLFNVMKIYLSSVAYYSPLYRYLTFSYHLVGDPLVRVFTDKSPPFKVKTTLMDGKVKFWVYKPDKSPVVGAKVVITDGERVVSKGYTDENGEVILTYNVPGGNKVYWGVNVEGQPLKVDSFTSVFSGNYVKVDSVYVGSGYKTNLIAVFSNVGNKDVVIRPVLLSDKAKVLLQPGTITVKANSTLKVEYLVEFTDNSPANFTIHYGEGIYKTTIKPKVSRVVFRSVKWYPAGDSIMLMFDFINLGETVSDTIKITRVINTYAKGLEERYYVKEFPPLMPNSSSLYRWMFKVKVNLGDSLRFYIYNGKVYQGDVKIVIDTVSLRADSIFGEPTTNGISLAWFGEDTTVRWKVYMDNFPLNIATVKGGRVEIPINDFEDHTFFITPVVGGIEGLPSDTIVLRANPRMRFALDIELIKNSGSEYPENSSPIISQLITSTPEPEIVMASAFNKLYILNFYGNIINTINLPTRITTTPILIGEYVVVGTEDGYISMVKYDGTIKWNTKLNGGESDTTPKFLMASMLDMDNAYVVAISGGGGMYVLDTTDGNIYSYRRFIISEPWYMLSFPATYDFDGDGNWEIVFKTDTLVYMLDKNLNEKPGFPIALRAPIGMHYTKHLFVWDINSDGDVEIVVCGHRNYIISKNGGILLRDSSAYYPNSYCIPVDFDGDGKYELAFYNNIQLGVYKWIGDQLVMLDTIRELYPTIRHPIVVDIDNDGKQEILISNSHGYLNAYSIGGKNYKGFPINLSDNNRYRNHSVVSAPTMITYGGKSYLFAPIYGNMLFSWEVPRSNSVWDMFRFNAWATNSPIRIDNTITTSGVAGNTERKTDVEISRRTLKVFGKGLIRVKVYSVAGRMVGEFEGLNGVEVDLTYPKGVYMVKITSGKGSRVLKVLVK